MVDSAEQNVSSAGVNQSTERINGGLFNDHEDYSVYTPKTVSNTLLPNQLHKIDSIGYGINNRPTLQMQGAQNGPASTAQAVAANGATIDQSQQAQFRDQQLQLGNALMAQANGQGPSVAGSQLQQSTEMNLQAAMAQAASNRGGNLGAAQYQLGNARANIQQQAAQQLAQTRIQEQMAARSQLGDVLNSGRGADIGLATSQAGMTQQNNQFNAGQSTQNNQFNAGQLQQNGQFNAGLLQQTEATNLGSAQEQQAAKDQLTQQYLAMGFSLQQATQQAEIQQKQFAAGLLAQQEAASKGVGIANAAQGTQLLGGLVAAGGAALTGGATAAAAAGAGPVVKAAGGR